MLPEISRPLFRDALAAALYIASGRNSRTNQSFSVIRQKTSTVFFPVKHMIGKDIACAMLENGGFSVKTVIFDQGHEKYGP